ncbi:hypothetical protein GE09DRAFT_158819 [Coniochaeta sp. 2T2.1]|nr:hypothetical protein GE09DRAFT_158819 [Coniochaeta sp. 2T2.1]
MARNARRILLRVYHGDQVPDPLCLIHSRVENHAMSKFQPRRSPLNGPVIYHARYAFDEELSLLPPSSCALLRLGSRGDRNIWSSGVFNGLGSRLRASSRASRCRVVSVSQTLSQTTAEQRRFCRTSVVALKSAAPGGSTDRPLPVPRGCPSTPRMGSA